MTSKNFQIVLYAIFGFLFLIGFVSLSLYGFLQKENQGELSQMTLPNILLWGTLPISEIEPIVSQLANSPGKKYGNVNYVEKDSAEIVESYIQALAVGAYPDLLLAEHEILFELAPTLRSIPFSSFPRNNFERIFIPAANMFLFDFTGDSSPDGYLALPFLSDALVLFYNENLRRQGGLRVLPIHWANFTEPTFTSIIEAYRESGKALIPLGGYSNYENGVDLFSTLVLQVREADGTITEDGIKRVLSFYSSFANPRTSVYTWNTTYPSARDMFVGNRLLFYPGFVSEFRKLNRANPNLVLEATALPQLSVNSASVTLARIYAFALPNVSTIPISSLELASDLLGTFYYSKGNCTSYYPQAHCASAFAPEDSVNATATHTSSFLSSLYSLTPAIQGYFPGNKVGVTESVFIDALFASQSITLSAEEKRQILDSLRNLIVGTVDLDDTAEILLPIFQ